MDRHKRILQREISRYLSLPNSCFRGKDTKHLGKVATSIVARHTLREKYKAGAPTNSQLCDNRAIVLSAPVSTGFVRYPMGIPILVPTPEFLWKLHDKYGIVSERTLGMLRSGERPSRSKHLGLIKQADPNNDLDEASFLHWIAFLTFTPGHTVQFGSWSELQNMLAGETIVWGEVSRNMKDYTRHQISSLRLRWRRKLKYPATIAMTK